MEGTKLAGRYQVLGRIGGGGMAVVYKGKDLLLDRYVAIKVMNRSFSHDQDSVRRFIREAKAAASMSHANIVNVYDVGREDSIYYMVMEYVKGPSLMDMIQKRGRFEPKETIEIAIQICEGLHHAHQKGIIHRDIKPHNILVAPGNQYKVTDFGISYFPRVSAITQTGYVMGSVHYFSPEQASGAKVSAASDLYSVGVVLYEMLTGRVPFNGGNSVSIALKHIHDPVPDPLTFNKEIPPALCEVVHRALTKDPEQRYQTARQMQEALEEVLASLQPVDAYVETFEIKPTERAPRNWKKRWWAVAGIAAASLLFIGFQLGNLEGESSSTPSSTKGQSGNPQQAIAAPADDAEGNYKWWKEIPKESRKESIYFRDIKVSGKDGNYHVSLKVNNELDSGFHYTIYVVDQISSRPLFMGRYVHFKKEADQQWTDTNFTVKFPKSMLQTTKNGIVKIEVYRSKKVNGESRRVGAAEALLQLKGELPEFMRKDAEK
ncbi:protein kinase domain-containing protein [Laceyella putida]|uniref:Protein kinase n=1 Tax=Laceyella putida TaxID=110101 RepID=A0ABW2RGL8_9BACL